MPTEQGEISMIFSDLTTAKSWRRAVRPRNVLLVLCLSGLFFSCLSRGAAPGEQLSSRGTNSGHPLGLPCQSNPDLDSSFSGYLTPNTAVLIGEMHGTRESPKFVQDVACYVLSAEPKRSVAVALEIPSKEDSLLQRFLEGDRQVNVTDSPFWKSTYQDGRRSIAMRDLIMQLREWRETTHRVRLL